MIGSAFRIASQGQNVLNVLKSAFTHALHRIKGPNEASYNDSVQNLAYLQPARVTAKNTKRENEARCVTWFGIINE